MSTNFFGPLTLTRLLIPHFRTRRSGTIVQISSVTGFEARASRSLYSASKFALEGFSEALYNEMQPFGVRVLIVEPGAFNSEFSEKIISHEKELLEDYRGGSVEVMMGGVVAMRGGGTGGVRVRNDVRKGVQAIWDVVS